MQRFRLLSVTALLALAGTLLVPSVADAATATTSSPVTLDPGQSVSSPDGRFRLMHQHDGNVVLYGPSGAVWNTKTTGHDTSHLVFQGDGNLVLYGEGRALWHTGTTYKGRSLAVQNDANLAIYDSSRAVWAIKGMAPPTPSTDVRGSTSDGCGGWRHNVQAYFGGETATACRVLMCESQGNRYADNPNSTASGLWQFLDSTWRNVTGTSGPAKNYSPTTQTRAAKKLRDSAGFSQWSCY